MRRTFVPLAAALLALVLAAGPERVGAAPGETPSLLVLGPDGRTVTLTAADLAVLPRAEAALEHAGRRTRFEGARLAAVLGLVGAPQGPALRGSALALVVVAVGKDGYRAALGLADADPGMRAEPVIVADHADGAPLAEDGPFRLVVGGDLRPARSVRNLVSLEVRRLGPP